MSGRWRIAPDALGPHDPLLIETPAGVLLSLNDPPRFGSLDLVPTSALDAFPAIAALGPAPLRPVLSAPWLAPAFPARTAPLKPGRPPCPDTTSPYLSLTVAALS